MRIDWDGFYKHCEHYLKIYKVSRSRKKWLENFCADIDLDILKQVCQKMKKDEHRSDLYQQRKKSKGENNGKKVI